MPLTHCNRHPDRKEEFSMSASPTSHGQSGFMSVESIGNALFYLIMIGIAALVVSVVMNTGKGGGDISAISMVRSNLQYVGTNAGSYAGVNNIVLESTVPFLGAGTAAGNAILPSGHRITVAPVGATSSQFNIVVSNQAGAGNSIDRDLCRKYAYYGTGSNFSSVLVTAIGGGTTPIVKATMVANIEGACGGAAAPESVTLLSN